jgi:hypothetical protein
VTDTPQFFRYWKVERDKATWNKIPDTPEAHAEAVRKGAMFFTVLALDGPPDSETTNRRGPLSLDFDDSRNPGRAFDEMREAVIFLEEFGVDPHMLRIFLSGGKGGHIEVDQAIVGLIPGPHLHLEHKKFVVGMVEALDLKTVDLSLYAAGMGKMFRQENVIRRNGRCKVQITPSELIGLTDEELLELTRQPRTLDPDELPLDPQPCDALQERFERIREEVRIEVEERKNFKPVDLGLLRKLQGNAPACVSAMLRLTENPRGGNFNKISIDLCTYFHANGIDRDAALGMVRQFIRDYTGSATYPTESNRLKHFLTMFEYCGNNPRYSFSCAAIKALRMPGNMFECKQCPVGMPFQDESVPKNENTSKNKQSQQDTSQFEPGGDADISSAWENPVNLIELVDVVPPPVTWFAQDRIIHGRGLLLCGVGGSSKTKAMYQLAVGAVLGQVAWGWNIPTTGKAVLVLTEDIAEEVHRTIHNICLGLDLTRDEKLEVYSNLICYPLAGELCTLLALTKDNAMVETELFRKFEDKVSGFGNVAFVGIDPALSVTTGNELDQGHARALGRMADNLAVRIGSTVCMVAHAAKNSLMKEELDSHNSRGAGAITDAVRSEISMRTMTQKEAKSAGITSLIERKRHVQMVVTKGNLLPPDAFVPVWLRRDTTGTLCAAEIEFDTGDGPNKKERQALEILQELCKVAVPSRAEWMQACDDNNLLGNGKNSAKKRAMDRMVDALKKYSLVEKGHGRGVYIPVEDDFDFND